MYKARDVNQPLKAGELLLITRGAYSDKATEGPLRLLMDTTLANMERAYRMAGKLHPESVSSMHEPDDAMPTSDFVAWLVKSRFVEHVSCQTWHIGDYTLETDPDSFDYSTDNE